MDIVRRLPTAIASIPLAICRAVYCWAFLVLACLGVHNVFINTQELLQKHSAGKGDIISNVILATYTLIFAVAWWMILRSKPALQKWAIAANCVIVFVFFPILALRGWRPFWDDERYWLFGTMIGVFGIIIFSIPYYGWPRRSQIASTQPHPE